MTSTTIADDLDAIESIIDVGVLRDPELLTCFTRDWSIIASYDSITEDRLLLASDTLNLLIELERFKVFGRPWCEPATFSIVIASSKEHLWSNEHDPLIEAKDATIVERGSEMHWHTDINENVFGEVLISQYLCKSLPAMSYSV